VTSIRMEPQKEVAPPIDVIRIQDARDGIASDQDFSIHLYLNGRDDYTLSICGVCMVSFQHAKLVAEPRTPCSAAEPQQTWVAGFSMRGKTRFGMAILI